MQRCVQRRLSAAVQIPSSAGAPPVEKRSAGVPPAVARASCPRTPISEFAVSPFSSRATFRIALSMLHSKRMPFATAGEI